MEKYFKSFLWVRLILKSYLRKSKPYRGKSNMYVPAKYLLCFSIFTGFLEICLSSILYLIYMERIAYIKTLETVPLSAENSLWNDSYAVVDGSDNDGMAWRSTWIHESLAKIFFAFLCTIFYRCRKHCLRAQLYIGPDRSQTYDEPWVIHDMIFILHSYIVQRLHIFQNKTQK